jgi:hypothetical protein
VLLRETAMLGVRTRAQCLAHLGKHFRAVRGMVPGRFARGARC